MERIILGRVTGKSAYEIAVENGFNGTETAWLESLKSASGTGSGVLVPAGSEFKGNATMTKTFDVDMQGFSIANDGTESLNFSINGFSYTVLSNEAYESVFNPFREVVITATGSFRAIPMTLMSASTPATPFPDTAPPILTITSGGTFTGTKIVTMSTNETSDIFYTLDGTEPSVSSTKYTYAVTLSATTTLKAFAKDVTGNSSSIQTVVFTKGATDTTLPVVSISPASGTYPSSQSVTITTTKQAAIFYTLDGSTPTTDSLIYSGPITVKTGATVKALSRDEQGNVSAVQETQYVINIPTGVPVTVTNGLVNSYNFTALAVGAKSVPDAIGDKPLTLSTFDVEPVTDGGLKGDGKGTATSGNLLAIPSSYTLFVTFKWRQSREMSRTPGDQNLFSLSSELHLKTASQNYLARVGSVDTNFRTGTELSLYPAHLRVQVVCLKVDVALGTVTLNLDGEDKKTISFPTASSHLPALSLFGGSVTPNSISQRGFQTFYNALFYNRILTSQEIKTVVSEIKVPDEKISTSNNLTTVSEGIVEAYDFKDNYDGYFYSKVGYSSVGDPVSIGTVTKDTDGSTLAGNLYPQFTQARNGRNFSIATKFRMRAAGSPSFFRSGGFTIRQTSATSVTVAIGSGTTVPVSNMTTNVSHTIVATGEDIGTGVRLTVYLNGLLASTPIIVPYASLTSSTEYKLQYPNNLGLEVAASAEIAKYNFISYDRTLSASEANQVHADLITK